MKRTPLKPLIALAAACLTAACLAPPLPCAAQRLWENDYGTARERARAEGKPLLVLFRCARRVSCPEVADELERPADAELAALLSRYVPVRLYDIRGVDLSRFQFDYDLDFAVLLMNAEGYTYSRFGTRDAEHPRERMSVPGLKRALREVLAEFARGPHHPSKTRAPVYLTDFRSYTGTSLARQTCAHCHYATNYGYFEALARGTFNRRMLYRYPLPENVGLTLEVDRNNVVQAVRGDSPAGRAGVRAGDVLQSAERVPVHTAADLQFALQELPEPAVLRLALIRGQRRRALLLKLPAGWRETDISWRAGQASVPPVFGFWEEPLPAEDRRALGLSPGRLALRVVVLFQGEKWARARGDVRPGDVLLGMDGRDLPNLSPRQFHTYYRLHHRPGETVELTVLRGGERRTLTLECVDARVE